MLKHFKFQLHRGRTFRIDLAKYVNKSFSDCYLSIQQLKLRLFQEQTLEAFVRFFVRLLRVTSKPGINYISFIYSHKRSTLDHSAAAPPPPLSLLLVLYKFVDTIDPNSGLSLFSSKPEHIGHCYSCARGQQCIFQLTIQQKITIKQFTQLNFIMNLKLSSIQDYINQYLSLGSY